MRESRDLAEEMAALVTPYQYASLLNLFNNKNLAQDARLRFTGVLKGESIGITSLFLSVNSKSIGASLERLS